MRAACVWRIDFGGSLYSMSDPFFVFIITMNFGSGYIVWDKSATIDFLKPAKGTILGIFEISKDRLEQIRFEMIGILPKVIDFSTDLLKAVFADFEYS